MDSTITQDLLDLKSRIDHWRSTRRFIREALPADLRDAIAETVSGHPVHLGVSLSGVSLPEIGYPAGLFSGGPNLMIEVSQFRVSKSTLRKYSLKVTNRL